MKKVAIVGGGIAGLATAHYLQKLGQGAFEYTLIEQEPRFGGKIVSARENGFVVEGGPDSFLTTKPAAIELCHTLGLGEQLIGTNDPARRVFVWSHGKLRAMPEGVMLIIPTKLMPFALSPLISIPGKIRMGMELLIPPRRDEEDESLAHFVRRRLGEEALDRIAEPMIAGIYVADAEYLSLKSTFPRFMDMETKYGGLLRGVIAQKLASRGKPAPKATTPMFMTLSGGLTDLVDAILSRLNPNSLISGRKAVRVTPCGSGYQVALDDGRCLAADSIVMASPTFATADAIQALNPELSDLLRKIRYASTATVSFGYKRSEIGHSLQGFGFVVPRSEKRRILACSWSSTKFSYRAGPNHALLRVFIGGAHAERYAEQSADELTLMAREEVRAMMGISAEPVLTKVYRWNKGNPQYEVNHARRVAEIEDVAARTMGLHLVGGAYHGVGIPDCIEDGKRIAARIIAGTAGSADE